MRPTAHCLTLALLACAAGLAAAVPTATGGPLCAKAPPSFLNVLKEVPAPPADTLCSWLIAKPGAPVSTCDLIAVIETSLSSGSGANRTCDPTAQYTLEYDPVLLPDVRPLPTGDFPDVANVFEAEGATLHWMYSIARNLENFLPCYQAGRSWPPPPGWLVHTTMYLNESGVQTAFGVVLANAATSQVVVALRGTMTAFEWGLDWSYNQARLTTASPDYFNTPVQAGFASAFAEVWPEVEAALEELVAGSPNATQVFVTGHSLGAAVATLVSYAAQSWLDDRLGDDAPVVSAALFAPPNVGGPQFVGSFNQLVNARRIAHQYDIVPQAFCTPTMPSCSAKGSGGLLGRALKKDGISAVPTNEPGNVSEWAYSQIGGSLPIRGDEMPQDTASWPALADIQVCWAFEFLMATHTCSYTCFTSQFAPAPAANQSNCWLSPRPDGAPGSACIGWPTNYPGLDGASAPSPA